jgi:streptogramin lyase
MKLLSNAGLCVSLVWIAVGCSNAANTAPPAVWPDITKPSTDITTIDDDTQVVADTEDPGTDQPDSTVQDSTVEDGAVQPDINVPDSTETGTDAVNPGTDEPDATVQPDVPVQPDATKPDTAQPDAAADSTPNKCIDEDGDGFGKFCVAGLDCDDANPNFAKACPNCNDGNVPGCSCKGIAAPCYSGDPNWVGKGICKAGVQPCKDGFWGACNGETMPENEACDNLDNDCDGQTDEGVKSSCGTCDMSCSQQAVGPQLGNPFELNSENSTGVGLDQNGYIVIDQQKISLNLKYIWVSNSPESTVSKVDCKTGNEVGRYKVCSDPSRTSVDLLGNVWVGCRGDGRIVKIISEKQNCIDKNNNGIIETAEDKNNSKTITPDEMVGGPGADECVKFMVQPGGTNSAARGIGVDKENHAWVGKYDNKLYRLEPENGTVIDTIAGACGGPYGMVIDQKGILWIQCGQLVRVEPLTKKVSSHGSAPGQYGINVDKFGKIWIGSYSVGAARYDPLTGQWQNVAGCSQGSGIATSNDGFVWVANDGAQSVTKINAQTMQVVGSVKIGGGPHGIALDYDGFVWGVNWNGHTISKVDPNKMIMVGDYPVGNGPYTYSDMTGYTLNYFTAPKGQYVVTFFGGTSANPIMVGTHKVKWQTIAVEAELPEKTAIQVRYRTGDDAKTLEVSKWTEAVAFPPAVFPLDISASPAATGLMLQVELQLITSEKGFSPAVKGVTATAKVE